MSRDDSETIRTLFAVLQAREGSAIALTGDGGSPWDVVRALVDFSPAFFIAIDADGKTILMNERLLRLLGYTIDQVVGTDAVAAYVPADQRRWVSEMMENRRATGGEMVNVHDVLTRDGRRVTVEWHGRSIFQADGGLAFHFAIGFDPAARRPAEEQLREREQQYRAIFEATSDGLVIIEPETWRIVEANPAACRIYGYSYEELLTLDQKAEAERAEFRELRDQHLRSIAEFLEVDPETVVEWDDETMRDRVARAILSGRQYRSRTVDIRKDGTRLHLETFGTGFVYRGKPHILGVVRDVTEQVEAYTLLEQRVEERTRELRTLVDVSRTVTSTLELETVLRLILDQLQAVVDYTGSSIMTLEGDDLVIVHSRGPTRESTNIAVGNRFPLGDGGGIWRLISHREPVIIPDVRGDGELAATYREALGERMERPPFEHIRSWMAAPLALKDRVIGMLSCSRYEPDYFTRHQADLMMTIGNQAAVAIENARLYQQARELAVLQERQRLARELHDSVSQALYGIALGARTARTLVERDPARAVEPLEYVLSLAEAGLAEMRALLFELRPESLEVEGLVAALQKQADSLRARHRVEVDADLPPEPLAPLEVKEALYRIAQEALNNTVKHARATRVTLRLAPDDGALLLEVRDDGRGFDPSAPFPGHLGLRSMRERAAALGGDISIESALGEGTRVRARVPVGAE